MPDSFDGNLSSYDDDQLRCRTGSHAWIKEHWVPVELTGRKVTAWDVHYECANCDATKTTEMTPNLSVIRSKIKYPPGYLLSPGNRFTRQEFRRERVNRVIGKPRLNVVR